VHLVKATPQHLPQYRYIHLPLREADNVHRRQGFSAHGVDIAQGIGRSNLSELVRVVHYRREEIERLDNGQLVSELIDAGIQIERLDNGQLVSELIDAGILGPLNARDEIRVELEGQSSQRFGEVSRTYLASSTRTVNGLGEALLSLVTHVTLLFGCILPFKY